MIRIRTNSVLVANRICSRLGTFTRCRHCRAFSPSPSRQVRDRCTYRYSVLDRRQVRSTHFATMRDTTSPGQIRQARCESSPPRPYLNSLINVSENFQGLPDSVHARQLANDLSASSPRTCLNEAAVVSALTVVGALRCVDPRSLCCHRRASQPCPIAASGC
jgi:hypothetical protein